MRASFATKTGPANPLDEIDVRVKMLTAAVSAVMTVAISSLNAQILLFVVSLAYLLMLKRPKLIAVSYMICAVMMALAVGFGFLVAKFIPEMGKSMTLSAMTVPFLRAFTMMNVVLPLAFSGRLQNILSGLQKLKLPFVVYLPSAVIIRFIPTFANDVRQIWESLKIRGYPINPWTCTIHPIRTTRLLFTPLLFRALKTSDELGIAAELKGLSAKSHSGAQAEAFKSADWYSVAILILICAAAVLLQIYFPNPVSGGMK